MVSAVVGSETIELPEGVNDVNQPLTEEEKAELVKYLPMDQALLEKFLANVEPAQMRMFLSFCSGESDISREEFQKWTGLSDEEVDVFYGDSPIIGAFSNPFGDMFLRLLALTYSLNLDMRQQLMKMIKSKKEMSIDAADERFCGAIAEAICAAVAVVATVGSAFKNLKTAKELYGPNAKKMPHEDKELLIARNQWFSPMGVQLYTQPLGQLGSFLHAIYEKNAAYSDANAQEADALYQQLLSLYQSLDSEHGRATTALGS